MDVIPDMVAGQATEAERALHIERPFGLTLLFALSLLVLMLSASELLTRSPFFKAHVTSSDIGSTHAQFELQRGRLETVVAATGSVDCIFLGNSMVWRGFDPLASARAFREEAGRELRCFNFGVDGMPASAAAVIASTLVRDYQPRYLIYGTDARDYAVPSNARDAIVLLETPWLRYRQGNFSLNGWLYEHIHFLRYRESLGYLLRMEKQYLIVRNAQSLGADHYGFGPDSTVGDYIDTSPLEHQELGPVRYYLGLLSEYTILPEHVRALEEITALNGNGTQVIVVEMPVPETYLEFFGRGEADYNRFLDLVANMAQSRSVPFLRTRAQDLIPDDGWVDYSHLNNRGARAFSRWLAQEMVSTGVVVPKQR